MDGCGIDRKEDPLGPRTPSIPRTAGAEYLHRGMTCGTQLRPPKQGDLEGLPP